VLDRGQPFRRRAKLLNFGAVRFTPSVVRGWSSRYSDNREET
jgi:hypothetical protein